MPLRDWFGHHHSHDTRVELALILVLENQEKIMAAIDDLKAAVAKLQTDIDALLAKPAPTPGTSDADIAAVTEQVSAIDAKVVAAP